MMRNYVEFMKTIGIRRMVMEPEAAQLLFLLIQVKRTPIIIIKKEKLNHQHENVSI